MVCAAEILDVPEGYADRARTIEPLKYIYNAVLVGVADYGNNPDRRNVLIRLKTGETNPWKNQGRPWDYTRHPDFGGTQQTIHIDFAQLDKGDPWHAHVTFHRKFDGMKSWCFVSGPTDEVLSTSSELYAVTATDRKIYRKTDSMYAATGSALYALFDSGIQMKSCGTPNETWWTMSDSNIHRHAKFISVYYGYVVPMMDSSQGVSA